MGLTIHYSFESDARGADDARRLVEQLHRAACDLPFAEVGDLLEFSGADADAENVDPHDPHRWLLIQSKHLLLRDDHAVLIAPLYVIAFATTPGEGCEDANFGLCRYPATIEFDGGTISTGLDHWHWMSFCKTQYASNPGDGGIENFLRCHLTIIRLLDWARELNMLAEVKDEGGFWEHRNVAKLIQTIGQWNRHLAGFVGQVKDWFGDDFVAPITDYPNFEHLEADDRRE